jgi:hypothetical protein
MTPEEKTVWNRAYYLRNRQKYLDRSREFHNANRQKCIDYQRLYYERVTKAVRQGKGATTPIKNAPSHRTADRTSHRQYHWSTGRATIQHDIMMDWTS